MEPLCKVDLACPAKDHHPNCPWHPTNVENITVSDDVWDQLERDLAEPPKDLPKLKKLLAEEAPFVEPLREDELAQVDKILDMLSRGVNANAYTFSLAMRYSPDRWKLITDEVAHRVKEKYGA